MTRPLPYAASTRMRVNPGSIRRTLTCSKSEIKATISGHTITVTRSAMLESSFILLNGIGETTERRFWDAGVLTWQDFLGRQDLPGLSTNRKSLYDGELRAAAEAHEARNARYFRTKLKARDHWRLYDTFKPGAVYLDIETTGAPADVGEVTVVGLYGQGKMTTLIRGETLTEARLNDELARASLLVTFFGSGFDLPFLKAKFPGLALDQPHIDLCFAARRLKMTGGLKHIETECGIERTPDLRGLDGWDAVRLWHAYRRGDEQARDLLVRYNEADVRNLEPLAEFLVGRLTRHAQLPGATTPVVSMSHPTL